MTQDNFVKIFEVNLFTAGLQYQLLTIASIIIANIVGAIISLKIINKIKAHQFVFIDNRLFMFLLIGCPMIIVDSYNLSKSGNSVKTMLTKYNNNNFLVVEGIVKVINAEPYNGHSAYKTICISDKCFTFSYYSQEN